MRNISFAATTSAFCALEKSVTRRAWKPRYAAALCAGDQLAAWDHLPRVGGGGNGAGGGYTAANRLGTIRLLTAPRLESTALAPGDDYDGEGFAYLDRLGAARGWTPAVLGYPSPAALWAAWHSEHARRDLYVVRFEVVERTEWAVQQAAQDAQPIANALLADAERQMAGAATAMRAFREAFG